jgi:hypothetical protein
MWTATFNIFDERHFIGVSISVKLTVYYSTVSWGLVPICRPVFAQHLADPNPIVKEEAGPASSLGLAMRIEVAPD